MPFSGIIEFANSLFSPDCSILYVYFVSLLPDLAGLTNNRNSSRRLK